MRVRRTGVLDDRFSGAEDAAIVMMTLRVARIDLWQTILWHAWQSFGDLS